MVNPFSVVFVSILEAKVVDIPTGNRFALSLHEKHFLSTLLMSPPKDLVKNTAKAILADLAKNPVPPPLATPLVKKHLLEQRKDTPLASSYISGVVAAPDNTVELNSGAAVIGAATDVLGSQHPCASFCPLLERPAPPLLECLDAECECLSPPPRPMPHPAHRPAPRTAHVDCTHFPLCIRFGGTSSVVCPRVSPSSVPVSANRTGIWMCPTESTHTVLWDASMGVDNSQGSEVRGLMKKACKSSLGMQQQQFVLAEINKDPKLVCVLPPPHTYIGTLSSPPLLSPTLSPPLSPPRQYPSSPPSPVPLAFRTPSLARSVAPWVA